MPARRGADSTSYRSGVTFTAMVTPGPYNIPAGGALKADRELDARGTRRLLRIHPVIRARQLDSHIREEKMQRLAVRCAAVFRRNQERASFLIALPRCQDVARLGVPSVLEMQYLDALILPDEQVPGVAGRVSAAGILHRYQVG